MIGEKNLLAEEFISLLPLVSRLLTVQHIVFRPHPSVILKRNHGRNPKGSNRPRHRRFRFRSK